MQKLRLAFLFPGRALDGVLSGHGKGGKNPTTFAAYPSTGRTGALLHFRESQFVLGRTLRGIGPAVAAARWLTTRS